MSLLKEILAISCWALWSITSIQMQAINYHQRNDNDDQQRQYEPNTRYVSYQYVRTPYTDPANKHQFVLQHEQPKSSGDYGRRQRIVGQQHVYQNAPNTQSNFNGNKENQQKYEQQQQQEPQRIQQLPQQKSQKYQQYHEPQQLEQYHFQSQTAIRQQQQQRHILQPQKEHKQKQQQQHYYQQQQSTDQYLQSSSNVEHNYQQLINNNNNYKNKPAAVYEKYQQQYQQQPFSFNSNSTSNSNSNSNSNNNSNKQMVTSFLPSYLDDESDSNMLPNGTQPCQQCCVQFEEPCRKCCSTAFLSATVLKSATG